MGSRQPRSLRHQPSAVRRQAEGIGMPRNLGFVMVTGRQRSSESWPEKKTCSWLVIVLGSANGREHDACFLILRYFRGRDEAGLTFDTQQLARAGLRNRCKQVRHKRKKVFKSVARRDEQDNSDSRSGEVLLKL